MSIRVVVYIFIGLLLTLTNSANAATDGDAGSTSSGTANISFSVPKLIRIRGFQDFNPSTYSGTGTRADSGDLNVSTNYGTSTRTYSVTVNGSGAGGAFTTSDGLGNTLAYTAFYNQTSGITGRVMLTEGVALTGRTGAAKPLTNTTLNANLSINFSQANLQAAEAGTYTGTLTVVVTPE